MEIRQTRKLKKFLGGSLKLLVTLWAIYYVLNHIDRDALFAILKTAHLGWLFLAFLAFNASKILSAVRLNRYFRIIGVYLDEARNLRLYYLGMFYNLFLPGGISGDGYKIYLLGKCHNTPYKKLFGATLLDRISGLAALLFLAGILFVLSTFGHLYTPLLYVAVIVVLLIIPINYFLTEKFFYNYLDIFTITTLYAFGVQLLQLLCAALIVWALPPSTSLMVDYLTLFLISSIVAVLPISIGGIGVRELTFLFGFSLIGGDTTEAVTFSLIFFAITALSSLLGVFVKSDL